MFDLLACSSGNQILAPSLSLAWKGKEVEIKTC